MSIRVSDTVDLISFKQLESQLALNASEYNHGAFSSNS